MALNSNQTIRNLSHNLHQQGVSAYQQTTAFIKSRGYSARVWLTISIVILVPLIGLIIIIIGWLTPPLVQPHYEPFTSKQEYEQFLKDNPLYQTTPPADQSFTLSKEIRADKSALYIFNLTAKPLKPDMSASYLQSYFDILDDSHQKALQWIKDNNQDPEKMSIIWRPNPDEMRQILLKENNTKPLPQKTTPTPTASTTPRPTFAQ